MSKVAIDLLDRRGEAGPESGEPSFDSGQVGHAKLQFDFVHSLAPQATR